MHLIVYGILAVISALEAVFMLELVNKKVMADEHRRITYQKIILTFLMAAIFYGAFGWEPWVLVQFVFLIAMLTYYQSS